MFLSICAVEMSIDVSLITFEKRWFMDAVEADGFMAVA